MKYTFLSIFICTFFLFSCPAIAQDRNQANPITINDINQLADSLAKANNKDIWDILGIVSSLLVPASITIIGIYYSNISKTKEIELQKNRDAVEIEVAKINTKIEQARILATFMDTLLSEDPKKTQIGIKAISLALPEESRSLIETISIINSDEKVQEAAKETLQETLKYLVADKNELNQLYRLYEGENQPRSLRYEKQASLMRELRHLRSLGLIENQPSKTIGGMADSGNLKDYVKMTSMGNQYIQDRERNGLYNPRAAKKPEYWISKNKEQ